MSEATQTYDFVCFTDLVYEFDPSVRKSIEAKIKRRLKYHQLGKYDQQRIDYIRTLKEELAKEISSGEQSKYFLKTKSDYAELNDFDIKKMQSDYAEKFSSINKDELLSMINFAIYSFHLR